MREINPFLNIYEIFSCDYFADDDDSRILKNSLKEEASNHQAPKLLNSLLSQISHIHLFKTDL